ncbi:hypothetical protein CDAR_598461 [Caerostris darwini]|uniref:Uncharacterized protein n=1 Tax=Caerostris darwini TaxID=1538125 RepID=A0AAV4QLA8_9ARAC|nr:hypothetical protein CDAR_598461 [Caerostris darwini]
MAEPRLASTPVASPRVVWGRGDRLITRDEWGVFLGRPPRMRIGSLSFPTRSNRTVGRTTSRRYLSPAIKIRSEQGSRMPNEKQQQNVEVIKRNE